MMILLLTVFISHALYLGFKDVMKLKRDAFMMDMQDLPYTRPEIKKSLFEYLEVANINSLRQERKQLLFPGNLWEQGYRTANQVIADLPRLIARERNIETEYIIEKLP
jgi:hypothetical protein